MYEANGVTAGFPLPQGISGDVVVLVSPTGAAVKVNRENYTVQDGAVFFYVPPPAGWIVAFEFPENAAAPSVATVVYPDGTMKQMAQDPWELLAEAKTERDEAKKLLREAQNSLEAAERVVHVESEIAKEKLSARLDKYGSLVEDSIRQAAAGARDELQDSLSQQIQEVRTARQEAITAQSQAWEYREAARQAAEEAAAATEQRIKPYLDAETVQAIEACERVSAMRAEIAELQNQARNAAANTGVELLGAMRSITGAVIEQLQGLRAGAENELKASVAKVTAEVSALVPEIKTARDTAMRAAAQAFDIERRCAELDKAQAAREEGMRALWTRISGFKKTFDHRVGQMRSAAAGAETGEGEEQV